MVYKKVLRYCKKNKLSIHAFEKKCGIGNGSVKRWIDDRYQPTLITLKKISNATGIPIEEWI